jgi:amidase
MTGFAEYDQYDGLGLAALVEASEVSPSELLEEAIARAEAVQARLNPLAWKMYDQARAQARGELPRGPFRGVPFLVKDLIQRIPGVPTQSGSRFWRGWTPDAPTTLYQRWLDSGVVAFAKTTTPELGIPPITESELHGPTRNPWNPERTSGGSSGGSGVVVAARVAPMASGGDGGGSIRIPASCCGVFGMKPTRARNPAGPFASENWSGLVVEHVITRTVRDSAAMLDATHGIEPTAPYAAPAVQGTFLEAAASEPGKLRIGFHSDPPFPVESHADCIAAVEDAAKLCAELGHEVEEISPDHPKREISRAFVTVYAGNIAADLREAQEIRKRRARRGDFEVSTAVARVLARSVSAEDFVVGARYLQSEARRMVERFGKYDAILTPTLCKPPVEIGELDPTGAEAVLQRIVSATGLTAPLKLPGVIEQAVIPLLRFAGFTQVANFTGQPSMSVPLYWNAENLPIGVMFTGRFGDEQTLFSLASQLERTRPWRGHSPPS